MIHCCAASVRGAVALFLTPDYISCGLNSSRGQTKPLALPAVGSAVVSRSGWWCGWYKVQACSHTDSFYIKGKPGGENTWIKSSAAVEELREVWENNSWWNHSDVIGLSQLGLGDDQFITDSLCQKLCACLCTAGCIILFVLVLNLQYIRD